MSTLFSVAFGVEAGDGDQARRRSGMVVALVESAAAADPSCRPLMLAFESWLLHPGNDTACGLMKAATDYVDALPEELRRLCWTVGAGLDTAVKDITTHGLHNASDESLHVIAEACDSVVSNIWVAHRCGVSRDALHRRLRDLRHAPAAGRG